MNITRLLIYRLGTVCACALVRLHVISSSWCGSQSDRWSVSVTNSLHLNVCSSAKLLFFYCQVCKILMFLLPLPSPSCLTRRIMYIDAQHLSEVDG